MELEAFIENVKQMDVGMSGILATDPSLLNKETYELWMALMMHIGMEPDCTDAYQTLGSYQFDEVPVEPMSEDKYRAIVAKIKDVANSIAGYTDDTCLLYTSPSPRDS